jgi:hypothetical protein
MNIISNPPSGQTGFYPRYFVITAAPVTAALPIFTTSVTGYGNVQRKAWEDLCNKIAPAVQPKILFQLFREPEHRLPVETVKDVLLYKMKLCRVLNQFNITQHFTHLFPPPDLDLCTGGGGDLTINGEEVLQYEPPFTISVKLDGPFLLQNNIGG